MKLLQVVQLDTSVWIVESLAHLLWQGTLIAAIAGVLAYAFNRLSSQVRYLLYIAALLLTALCFPMNLWYLNETEVPQAAVRANSLQLTEPMDGVGEDFIVFEDSAVAFPVPLEEYANVPNLEPVLELPAEANSFQEPFWRAASSWILLAYVAGIFLMSTRLTLGLYRTQRLRTTATPVSEASMLTTIRRLQKQIGLQLMPVIAYSKLVTSPVVVGILKPAILLPASLASNLSPEQLESLLLHEIAHIRRYDHLANLVQRILETLFFFHPTVWWLSNRISVEREHCCDDLAIRWGSEPCDFAEALVRVSELKLQNAGISERSATALAATGTRPTQLRKRVLRVLGLPLPGPALGLTRLGIATVLGIVVSCAVLFAASQMHLLREDLADFDFDNPPSAYEKGIQVADLQQQFTVDGLHFRAQPLQWNQEGWLRLNEEERGPEQELFLNLGVSGGYEVVEFRLFDHDTRELVHDSSWQMNPNSGASGRDFFIERIGATNWIRMKELSEKFPNKIDVWMRIATARNGKTLLLTAEEGASASVNGATITIDSLLAGRMSGKGGPDGKMVWDLTTARDQDSVTTVGFQNRGETLLGRYHFVAVKKDGSRHPMDDLHFRDFSKMGSYASVILAVALNDLQHIEMVPFKKRHKFFFNGLEVPTKETVDPQKEAEEETSNIDAEDLEQPTRIRNFVRIVAGKDEIAFQGEVIAREELEEHLRRVADRHNTVLEYGTTPDGGGGLDGEVYRLAILLGFEYFSLVGNHPLSAVGSADEEVAVDVAREKQLQEIIQIIRSQPHRYRILVVIDPEGGLTIDGHKIQPSELLKVLHAYPNRTHARLQIVSMKGNKSMLPGDMRALALEENYHELWWKGIANALGCSDASWIRLEGTEPNWELRLALLGVWDDPNKDIRENKSIIFNSDSTYDSSENGGEQGIWHLEGDTIVRVVKESYDSRRIGQMIKQKAVKLNENTLLLASLEDPEDSTTFYRTISFHGLSLRRFSSTTEFSALPDLLEEVPTGSNSFEFKKDVEIIYQALDGTVYYLPEKETYYIHSQPFGSSRLRFFGPYRGNPLESLKLPKAGIQAAKTAKRSAFTGSDQHNSPRDAASQFGTYRKQVLEFAKALEEGDFEILKKTWKLQDVVELRFAKKVAHLFRDAEETEVELIYVKEIGKDSIFACFLVMYGPEGYGPKPTPMPILFRREGDRLRCAPPIDMRLQVNSRNMSAEKIGRRSITQSLINFRFGVVDWKSQMAFQRAQAKSFALLAKPPYNLSRYEEMGQQIQKQLREQEQKIQGIQSDQDLWQLVLRDLDKDWIPQPDDFYLCFYLEAKDEEQLVKNIAFADSSNVFRAEPFPCLTDSAILTAKAVENSQLSGFEIVIELTEDGGKIFDKATENAN